MTRFSVCSLAVLLAATAFARTIIVPPVATPEAADTEISINVVIDKSDIGYSDLHFYFDGMPTNSLELFVFGEKA